MKTPKESIDAFYEAIIRKDYEAICAAYVEGADTYVFVEGPRYSTLGTENIFKGWRDFNAAPMALESITWTEGPYSEESGSMAWVAGILQLRVNVKGKVFEQTFRATFVLRKNAEEMWQIRQEHVSAPLPDPYGIGDWLKKDER
ncbi:MAG: nuclear transport factor 2 family protein [Candidatus Kapabacteria bacterium]|nr:nuclear transport factor 2 family protein [Candidatus Kapabacteria bacterium]